MRFACVAILIVAGCGSAAIPIPDSVVKIPDSVVKISKDSSRAITGFAGHKLIDGHEFIDIKTTPTDLKDSDRGAKYPYLMIEGIPITFDSKQKTYVTYFGDRSIGGGCVMWMGGTDKFGQTHYELFKGMDYKGIAYKLTVQGYVKDDAFVIKGEHEWVPVPKKKESDK